MGKKSQKIKAGTPKSKKTPQLTEKINKFLSGYYPLLFIAVIGFLIYSRTINYQYTYFDDHRLILQRMEALKDFSHVGKIFTEDAFHSTGKGFYYRPLEVFSFMTDARLGKGKFPVFHLTNIFLHILNSYFIFLLFIKLGYKRPLSFLFALIFLVHPVCTQTVAWVPGRNDSLLTLFVIVAFIFFIKYLHAESVRYQLLYLLFFILGLFTKETTVAFPVIAVIYMFVAKKFNPKLVFINGFVWVGVTFIWLVIRYRALGNSSGYSFHDSVSSMFGNLPAVIPYLGKIFIPLKLSSFPVLKDLVFHFITGFLAVITMAILYFKTNPKRNFYFLLGLGWFLLFLVPSLVQQAFKMPNFSEHRLYLSIVGILIFAAETDVVRKMKSVKFPVMLILLFAILSFVHTSVFADRMTFWTHAVKSSPHHAFNNNNLGAMYYLDNNLDLAERYFRKTIELNPDEPMANGNLGLVLMNTNRNQEAEQYYFKEIRINPTYDNAHFNLGVLYYKAGMRDNALPQFEQTILINPYYGDAYKYIVDYYLNKKDTAKALLFRNEALKYKIDIFK